MMMALVTKRGNAGDFVTANIRRLEVNLNKHKLNLFSKADSFFSSLCNFPLPPRAALRGLCTNRSTFIPAYFRLLTFDFDTKAKVMTTTIIMMTI